MDRRSGRSTRNRREDSTASISAVFDGYQSREISPNRAPDLPLPSSTVPAIAAASPDPSATARDPDAPSNINLLIANTSDVGRSTPIPVAIAYLPHTSAWSATRDSIAQRPANQCLEHQHSLTASTSNFQTVPGTFTRRMNLLGHM
ncbi:hypothetical protein SprV_0100369500 [Sparganum proliferum]